MTISDTTLAKLKSYHLSAEPMTTYLSRSASGEFMSSHLLADFRASPRLYYRKTHGLVPQTSSPALFLGSAAHTLILEGESAFRESYRIADGPVNPRTGEPFGRTTKAYAEWAAAQTKPCCSNKDYESLLRLKDSVSAHPFAKSLFAEGVPEGVARADCCGVPCQIRIDWFHPEHGIIDLKTCDSLARFEADCRHYGYIHQMAFYTAVYRELTGRICPAYLIAVEKSEPYSTGVWLILPETLRQAEEDNIRALTLCASCKISDVWPTGYESVRSIPPHP